MRTKDKPLVSIVTPCFNMGQYLKECIESVLNQDYPYVEHVIQDGQSSDNSQKILKKYSQKYKKKVRWASEPDKGQADGLNKALKRTKGEIILVLNADDILLPYACSWAVSNFKLFPDYGVIYGDEFVIDKKGKITRIAHGGEYNLEKLLCVELVPPAQAAFIQRSALQKVGFYADTSLDTCPDYEMWIRLMLKFPIKYIPGVVSKYRVYSHRDSHQPRTTVRFIKAKKEVMDRVFSDPKAPAKLKKLKTRAYAGLLYWAATEAFNLQELRLAIQYRWQAFFLMPSFRKFKKALLVTLVIFKRKLNKFKGSPIYYSKKLIKSLFSK